MSCNRGRRKGSEPPEDFLLVRTGKRLLNKNRKDESIAKRSCPEEPLKDLNGRSQVRSFSAKTKKIPISRRPFFFEETEDPSMTDSDSEGSPKHSFTSTPKSTGLSHEQVMDFDDPFEDSSLDINQSDQSTNSTPQTNHSTSSKETTATFQLESSDNGDVLPNRLTLLKYKDSDSNQRLTQPPENPPSADKCQCQALTGLPQKVIERMDRLENVIEDRTRLEVASSTSSSETGKRKKKKSMSANNIPLVVRVCCIVILLIQIPLVS